MPSRLVFAFVCTPAAGILPGRHVPAARVRTMDEVTDPQMASRIHRHAYVPGIEGDFRRAGRSKANIIASVTAPRRCSAQRRGVAIGHFL